MNNYIRHIQDPKSSPVKDSDGIIRRYSNAYCGLWLGMRWAYEDPEHARLSCQTDYILPCKKCCRAVDKEQPGYWDSIKEFL